MGIGLDLSLGLGGGYGGSIALPTENLILDAPAGTGGVVGGARTFNGTDELFSRAAHASHNLGTGDVLLSGMVQRGAAGNKAICGKYQDANNLWKLEFDANNKIHFAAVKSGSPIIDIASATAYTSTTAWYHVFLALDRSSASGCKLYVNAVDDTQTNQGLIWSSLGQQFSETYIYSMISFGGGICLAGTSGTGLILRSTDSGATWSNLGQQGSETLIFAFASLGGGICLAGTYPGGLILRSTDSGATWSSLGQQFSQSEVICFASLGGGICLAGTYGDGLILRSTDSGATWSNLGQQFSQVEIRSLVSLGGGICLAGTAAGLILRSTDSGATWSNLGQQFSQSYIYSLASLGGGICLAGTYPGGLILRSTDSGATWSSLGQQFSQTYISSLVSLGSGICLAGTSTGGLILRSTDSGATWSSLGQQFSQTSIAAFGSVGGGICITGTYPGGLILRSIVQVTSASDIDNTGAFQLGADGNGALFFQGSLATFGIAKPTDVTSITTAAVASLDNLRNGKTWNNISAAERTAWNVTSYYDLSEISGNALEEVADIDLTDNGSVGAGNGPAEAIAEDTGSVGTNHGQLLGFSAAQQITAWNPVTPDGSYTATVVDPNSANNGTMIGFADVDTARTTDVSPLCAVSQSIKFDGVNDYIEGPTIAAASFAKTPFAVSFWVKPNSLADLCGYLNTSVLSAGWTVYSWITGVVRLADNAGDLVTSGTVVLTLNIWNHVVITRTDTGATGLNIYINGIAGDVPATGDVTINGSGPTCIGRYYSNYNGHYAKAYLTDMRLYSSGLTSDECLYIATNGASGTAPSNSVGKWIGYDTSRSVPDCADGYGLTLDGTDDYVSMGNLGNVTSVDVWIKSLAANQELMTLAGSTETAITVVTGTLTFGATLAGYTGTITIDGVSKTAAAAGALLNDGAWHELAFTLTEIAASDFRIGTDSSAFGNIVVDQLELNGGTHVWTFNDGAQLNPNEGDPVLGHRSATGDIYFSQATISARPLMDLTTVNNKASLEFNGASKYMTCTQVNKATQQGCVTIHITTGASVASMCYFGITDTAGALNYMMIGTNASSKLVFTFMNAGVETSLAGGTTLAANTRYVVQFWHDGTTSGITLNGVAESTTGTDPAAWFADVVGADVLCLGALAHNSPTKFFEGFIAHYIAYDDETTLSKRKQAYRHLKQLYGIGV